MSALMPGMKCKKSRYPAGLSWRGRCNKTFNQAARAGTAGEVTQRGRERGEGISMPIGHPHRTARHFDALSDRATGVGVHAFFLLQTALPLACHVISNARLMHDQPCWHGIRPWRVVEQCISNWNGGQGNDEARARLDHSRRRRRKTTRVLADQQITVLLMTGAVQDSKPEIEMRGF